MVNVHTNSTTLDHLPDHLPFMDGIRGLAAMWVLLFHMQRLSGMRYIPLLSYGGLAVDLFMVISGVLITHHYLLRQHNEPWDEPRSWVVFWTRRLFRVAPLYYVLLFIGLCIGPYLGEYRATITQYWPQAITTATRYTNHGISNILAHVTFIFGTIPAYAYETPLPDWSISLEIQFYLAFPFIMLLIARIGAPSAAVILITLCLILEMLFKSYFLQFKFPSFLPMKLYMFFCGILISTGRQKRSMILSLSVAVAATLTYMVRTPGLESYMRVVMVIIIFYLFNDGSLPSFSSLDKMLDKLRKMLGSRLGCFLGDSSYCVYLFHLFILIPVAAYLLTNTYYVHTSGAMRYGICFLIVIPAVYTISSILHYIIEQPGIKFGKKAINYFYTKYPK